MAISINGVTVAGIGKDGKNGVDGKDATINGVNALTLKATGGIAGQQSGDTYTIDGSGLFPKSGGELNGNIVFTKALTQITTLGERQRILFNSDSERGGITAESHDGNSNTTCAFSTSASSGFAVSYRFKGALTSGISVGRTITLIGERITIGPNPSNQENIATEKYVDDIVGNINTLLDTINGEVI